MKTPRNNISLDAIEEPGTYDVTVDNEPIGVVKPASWRIAWVNPEAGGLIADALTFIKDQRYEDADAVQRASVVACAGRADLWLERCDDPWGDMDLREFAAPSAVVGRIRPGHLDVPPATHPTVPGNFRRHSRDDRRGDLRELRRDRPAAR